MVSVLIVTWNSAAWLERCLESVLAQDCGALEVVIVDNASSDGTLEILARYEDRARILYNDKNYGFAAAMNQALRQALGEWMLALNPDVLLRPDFVSQLVAAGNGDAKVGTVCGKLLRWKPGENPEKTNRIDCAGMYFLPNLRHLDRGAEQVDGGQFDRPEYVVGASGAAALFRRKMVEDVSMRGEFFDEDFFAYREDADLAWRAQMMGWRCLYTPKAVGWHVRRVTPERRSKLPLLINWHSVKNRFLMRIKNASRPIIRQHFWPILWRDFLVAAYALVVNRRLLSALWYVWDQRDTFRRKRQIVQARRRVHDADLMHWFSGSQAGVPLGADTGHRTKLKIAIVGTRGIPARYGGFETLAEKLSRQLAERGHEVTVYCRKAFTRRNDVVDPRIRRVILPSISRKHLDTFVSGFISAIHVACGQADVVLMCNVANSPFAWIPRVPGIPVALNVDGLDRTRRKWGLIARAYLYMCELLSLATPSYLVTDAKVIQDYYRRRYVKSSTVIGYGAEAPAAAPELPFPLPRGRYILYVSRLEKENNPEMVLRAYAQVPTDWPLVMVGWNPYDPGYVERLKAMADRRVVFTGPVYGDGYWALQKHAGIYVFAGEVGGIHPALVEAMCADNAVLYLDTDANRETAGDSGIQFRDARELAAKLAALVARPELVRDLAKRAGERARALYRWDRVADQYEELFAEMTGIEVRPAPKEAETAA
jgi:GT2 family glycosyltransferase/glycosyltransferase involved in cell wall biosynthesis